MTLQRTLCCVFLLAGCADRQADVEDDVPELLPACMIVNARGYWEDGSTKPIVDETGYTGTVCMCMTKEELNEGVWAEHLNELTYAECKRIEGLHYDFDWTNCQQAYEDGDWLFQVLPAVGDDANLNHTGLDCDGEPDTDESCSITNPDDGDPLLVLVFVILLGLRRPKP